MSLLQKVARTIHADLLALSKLRVNCKGLSADAIKKEPRHVPEPWKMRYRLYLASLAIAEIDVFDKGKNVVEITLLCFKPDWATDVCKAVGPRRSFTVRQRRSLDNSRSVLDSLGVVLSNHIGKTTGLPMDRCFRNSWQIALSADSVTEAKAALQQLVHDLQYAEVGPVVNGARTYSLSAYRRPPLRVQAKA